MEWSKKKLGSLFSPLMWFLFIGVSWGVGYYFKFRFRGADGLINYSYIDGLLGNLTTTVIGIILGVPFAISIWRWQEQKEQNQTEVDAKTKRLKILQLLLEELQHNKEIILRRLTLTETKYPHPELKLTVWQAFSNGGEIKWIDSPVLLAQIANAYHFIQLLNYDEENWYQAEITRDLRRIGPSPGSVIRKHIFPIYPVTDKLISQTIEMIKAQLLN